MKLFFLNRVKKLVGQCACDEELVNLFTFLATELIGLVERLATFDTVLRQAELVPADGQVGQIGADLMLRLARTNRLVAAYSIVDTNGSIEAFGHTRCANACTSVRVDRFGCHRRYRGYFRVVNHINTNSFKREIDSTNFVLTSKNRCV